MYFIPVLSVIFYILLSTTYFNEIAILLFFLILFFSFFDKRNLILGWFLSAPYFVMLGKQGEINIASNISHNLFVPFTILIIFGNIWIKNKTIVTNPLDKWYYLFLIFLILSSVITKVSYEVYRAIFIVYTLPFLLYQTIINIDLDKRFLKSISYISIFHLFVFLFLGIDEYLSGKSIYSGELLWQDTGVGAGRIAGPFLSPFIFGLFLIFILIQIIQLKIIDQIPKLFLYIFSAISGLLIFLTFTRSVWIAIVCGIIYVIFKTAKTKKYLKIVSIIILLFIVFTYILLSPKYEERVKADTGTIRMVVALASVNMFISYPIFGKGFGSFDKFIEEYIEDFLGIKYYTFTTSHVTILTFLAELGIVGTLVIVIYFMKIFSYAPKNRLINLSVVEKKIIIYNKSFIIGFLVMSFLMDMRFFSIAYSLLFMSIGIIVNLSNKGLSNNRIMAVS